MGASIFDLDRAKQREVQRRLAMLSDLINADFNYDEFVQRAKATAIPIKVLLGWHRAYCEKGESGLVPSDWEELDDQQIQKALERYKELGWLADSELVKGTEVSKLAERMDRSYWTAQRWLQRYRIGGLWGLTPEYNPLQNEPKHDDSQPRDIGSLDNAALEGMYQRREILGDLIYKAHASNDEVAARAHETGVSVGTIWNYLRVYRRYGLQGLAPKQRSDTGKRHGISERMVDLIEAIRLSNTDCRVRAVFELACRKARQLGENEPSEWQVRDICRRIPKPLLTRADGRQNEFRSKYKITYPMKIKNVVYQIDHTLVDVLVLDKRNSRIRAKSGQKRLWLTLAMEANSRAIVAAKFAYDRPYRHTVASVIRDSLLGNPGGMPDEVWVDNGKELVSRHAHQLTRELGIKLKIGAPHQPQHRGRVERFFGTLNSRLWSTLPGYTDSNTKDRNPRARANLTAQQLESKFWEFINGYHHERHSVTKQTPLVYWQEHCFALPMDDERRLDILLKEQARRTVHKAGIKYGGRAYWHAELGTIVGESVLIRADTNYGAPDDLEVFHNGTWICTAFALDSDRGSSVSREEIASAQKQQSRKIHQKIKEAGEVLEKTEDELMMTHRAQKNLHVSSATPAHTQTPESSEHNEDDTLHIKKRAPKDTMEELADVDFSSR